MEVYKINYSGTNVAEDHEEMIHTDTFLEIQHDSNIKYSIGLSTEKNFVQIHKPITLLLISTTNTAHSLCEIIDFIQYYKDNSDRIGTIGISETVKTSMPFLFELIGLFIPTEKMLLLEDAILYKCSTLVTYRLHHFNFLTHWDSYTFLKENINGKDTLTFGPLVNPFEFVCNTDFLFEKVRSIYSEHHHRFKLYDKIMLIKTDKDPNLTTSNRCLEYPKDSILEKLQLNDIHFLNIYDLKSIEEYICVLYHAKTIITSYGGPTCTNRFFFNQEATVIVLANNHYKAEYNVENYWHVRCTHLIPVNKQIFILDFENYLDDDNLQDVLHLIKDN
jgi:hypothetical protein